MKLIAGLYKGRALLSPKGSQTRPTSSLLRGAVFNICQNCIEGASFLDVFCGSGAIGLEALSRGAEKVVFIDSHNNAIHCLKKNIEQLGVEEFSRIMRGDVFSMLSQLEKGHMKFNVVYVDPPYATLVKGLDDLYSTKVIDWMDKHSLIAPGGILFIEEKKDFQPTVNNLKTLTLVNSRSFGNSVLQQYLKHPV